MEQQEFEKKEPKKKKYQSLTATQVLPAFSTIRRPKPVSDENQKKLDEWQALGASYQLPTLATTPAEPSESTPQATSDTSDISQATSTSTPTLEIPKTIGEKAKPEPVQAKHDEQVVVCPKCQIVLVIPPGIRAGHTRCQNCGTLVRVGMSSEYVRIFCNCGRSLSALKKHAGLKAKCPGCGKMRQIPYTKTADEVVKVGVPETLEKIYCPCGKVLTAHKRHQGKQGRCPKCGRTFIIGQKDIPSTQEQKTSEVSEILKNTISAPTPSTEVSTVPHFLAPIHFKCTCGQSHMVEGERAGSFIICFRCGNETKIPFPNMLEEIVATLQSIGSGSEPSHASGNVANWQVQVPYAEQDLFAILGISHNTNITDLKQAYWNLQGSIPRTDPLFQKAQLAKDALTKPEERLRYEILNGELEVWWYNLAKTKWLKLHDECLQLHKDAIAQEQALAYRKADTLWEKTMKAWLDLVKAYDFWEAAKQRGEQLFADKFDPSIIATLHQSILDIVIVHVSTQFIERYRAESNFSRMGQHQKFLMPMLLYLLQTQPDNIQRKKLMVSYFFDEIKFLADQSQWDKTIAKLLELNELFPSDAEVLQLIEEFFPLVSPFLSTRKQATLAARLGIQHKP